MKNRNLEHKNDWKTPQSLLSKLTEEFGELFDPCPFMHDISSWDGLKIEWGGRTLSILPILCEKKRLSSEKQSKRAKNEKFVLCYCPSRRVLGFFMITFYQTKKRYDFGEGVSNSHDGILEENLSRINAECTTQC